jgi:hypothetical protein
VVFSYIGDQRQQSCKEFHADSVETFFGYEVNENALVFLEEEVFFQVFENIFEAFPRDMKRALIERKTECMAMTIA